MGCDMRILLWELWELRIDAAFDDKDKGLLAHQPSLSILLYLEHPTACGLPGLFAAGVQSPDDFTGRCVGQFSPINYHPFFSHYFYFL
jgi:hypothetical protein